MHVVRAGMNISCTVYLEVPCEVGGKHVVVCLKCILNVYTKIQHGMIQYNKIQ